MFEFENSTYSGMLTILSCLFGIAYPLLLTSIERIDSKYKSTLLIRRFKTEKVFRNFQVVLVTNLLVAVVAPFALAVCNDSGAYIYLTIQVICTILVVTNSFCLYHTVFEYYDLTKLMDLVWEDFKSAREKSDSAKEEVYFKQWVDLSATAIVSADQAISRSVYDKWIDYLVFYNHYNNDVNIAYDNYAYEGIFRIMQNLCMVDNAPFSINNENYLLTSLFTSGDKLVDQSYSVIWRCLTLQIFYDKEDWLVSYWKSMSSYYRFNLCPYTLYDVNRDGVPYNETQKSIRLENRAKFGNYHLLFLALLLQQKKYSVLKRILYYTESQPPSYPLVPSTMADCISVFENLNSKRDIELFSMEDAFPMPNFDGLSYGKILGVTNSLIALLIYRLYTLPSYFYGVDWVFRFPNQPKNIKDINGLKDTMTSLKYYLDKIKSDEALQKVLEITDIDGNIKRINTMYKTSLDSLESSVNNFVSSLEKGIGKLKVEGEYDKLVISDYKNKVVESLKSGVKAYNVFMNTNSIDDAKKYYINSVASHFYPNEAFMKGSSVCYVNIDECIVEDIMGKFCHAFSTAFYLYNIENQNESNRFLAIDSGMLFLAFDKMKLKKDIHIIISFDIYWDYYIDRQVGFEKISKMEYRYNNIKIFNFRCINDLFSQEIYVLQIEDLPTLEFIEPAKNLKETYGLSLKDEEYQIWTNILKVHDNHQLLTDKDKREFNGNPEEYSIFAVFMQAKLSWKQNIPLYKIKNIRLGIENGNTDNIEEVMPFPNVN